MSILGRLPLREQKRYFVKQIKPQADRQAVSLPTLHAYRFTGSSNAYDLLTCRL